MPRPDPTDPNPGNPSHMPPNYGTNTLLPNPTTRRSDRRSPDPTPSETPPHITVDSRPKTTAQPRHTSVRTTTRWPIFGNPSPEVGYPPPRYLPHTAMGKGTTHEVSEAIMTIGSPAIHEPRHSGRGYTSFQPLPNLENTVRR